MPKTVLIAEDYADIRSVTKFMVEALGFEAIEAKDGFEAYQEAKGQCPDLILMDVAMPEMNGITAARLIRDCENCRTVPIVALTAYGTEYTDEAESFGFNEVLQKPIEIEDLDRLLISYLGEKPAFEM